MQVFNQGTNSYSTNEKTGQEAGFQRFRDRNLTLLGQKHVTRLLQGSGDRTLVLGRKSGVLPGKDLSCVGDITNHRLRIRERNFSRSGGLLILLGSAHEEA